MRLDRIEGVGIKTVIAQDADGLHTGMVQDCDPIAEDAKARHNAGMLGSSELKHAARVPMVFIEKYLHMQGITFQEFCNNKAHMKSLLSDPAISHFRIWKGAL